MRLFQNVLLQNLSALLLVQMLIVCIATTIQEIARAANQDSRVISVKTIAPMVYLGTCVKTSVGNVQTYHSVTTLMERVWVVVSQDTYRSSAISPVLVTPMGTTAAYVVDIATTWNNAIMSTERV